MVVDVCVGSGCVCVGVGSEVGMHLDPLTVFFKHGLNFVLYLLVDQCVD